jgi:hypothetical protein
MATIEKTSLAGGEWLLKTADYNSIFIPEEWSEEQQMIGKMCDDFLEKEVHPPLGRVGLHEGPRPHAQYHQESR